METFFAILIIVPTAAVLGFGVVLLVWLLTLDIVAGVDGIVVALQHRLHASARPVGTHWGNAALHH